MNTSPSRSANGLAAAHRLVDVGEQEHARIGRELAQHVALDGRYDDRDVHAPDQRQLLVASRSCGDPRAGASLELGKPLGAQEMQVDRVEREQRLGANWRTASMCFAAT